MIKLVAEITLKINADSDRNIVITREFNELDEYSHELCVINNEIIKIISNDKAIDFSINYYLELINIDKSLYLTKEDILYYPPSMPDTAEVISYNIINTNIEIISILNGNVIGIMEDKIEYLKVTGNNIKFLLNMLSYNN